MEPCSISPVSDSVRKKVIRENYIKGKRGFDLPLKKPSQTQPGTARHPEFRKESQQISIKRGPPISMIHADACTQLMTALSAQVKEVSIYH